MKKCFIFLYNSIYIYGVISIYFSLCIKEKLHLCISPIKNRFHPNKKTYSRLVAILFLFSFLACYEKAYSGDTGKRDVYHDLDWCEEQIDHLSELTEQLGEDLNMAHEQAVELSEVLSEGNYSIQQSMSLQQLLLDSVNKEASEAKNLLKFIMEVFGYGEDISVLIHDVQDLEKETYNYVKQARKIRNEQQIIFDRQQQTVQQMSALQVALEGQLQSVQQAILAIEIAMPQNVVITHQEYNIEGVQNRIGTLRQQMHRLENIRRILGEEIYYHEQNVALIRSLQEELEKVLTILREREGLLLSFVLGKKAQGPKPPPPPPGGASTSLVSFDAGEGTSSFVSGYDTLGNINSLQGLQCVLGRTTSQVSTILKMWSLKNMSCPHETRKNIVITHRLQNDIVSHIKRQKKPFCSSSPHLSLLSKLSVPYHMFSFSEGYHTNLEYKPHTMQAGIIAYPCLGLGVGLAYDYLEGRSDSFVKTQYNVSGSVKAKTTTNILSSTIAWNMDQTGLMGQIIGCYGWGYMRNTRHFPFIRKNVGVHSNPEVELNGGLLQLGYNIQSPFSIMFTPYIEGMFVTVGWKKYREHYGILSGTISNYKEQIWERSVGLRGYWDISPQIQVQAWISKVFGHSNTAMLKATSLLFSIPLYEVWLPVTKKNYIKNEIGMSYSMNLLDMVNIGLKGILHHTNDTLTAQSLQFSLRYMY